MALTTFKFGPAFQDFIIVCCSPFLQHFLKYEKYKLKEN